MTYDLFFNLQSPVSRNIPPANAFPPIGTFSIDSTTTAPPTNSIFNQTDYFTTPSTNQPLVNGSNGTNTFNNNTNANTSEINQATRETGIIEKLLVSFITFPNMVTTDKIEC